MPAAWLYTIGAWDRADGDTSFTVARWPEAKDGPMILHWLMHDITQNEQRLRRIEYLAYHDELTGLGNRRMLLGHLHQALARGRRKGRGVAVTCLDLDGFKLINDNLGHAGDELLRQVGARLRHVSRAAETVARLGGDEFTVVIEDLDVSDDPAGSTGPSEPVLAARRIKRALEEPYALAGVEVHVSVSLGISVHPTDARDEATLIEKADAEAYVAKQQARSDPLLAVDDQRGLGRFASLRLLKGLETHRPRPPGGREESSAGVSSSGGRVGKANVETTVLPMTSVAPSMARAAAVARLHGHAQDVVDSVVLLVSELVTFSVRDAALPAQGTLELIVRNLPNGARVEVAADGPETRFSEPPPEMGGGPAFGLLLLDRLADAWGSQSYPYRVWFEIASSPVRRR